MGGGKEEKGKLKGITTENIPPATEAYTRQSRQARDGQSAPNKTQDTAKELCCAQKQNDPRAHYESCRDTAKDYGYTLSANFYKPILLHVGQVNSLPEKSTRKQVYITREPTVSSSSWEEKVL